MSAGVKKTLSPNRERGRLAVEPRRIQPSSASDGLPEARPFRDPSAATNTHSGGWSFKAECFNTRLQRRCLETNQRLLIFHLSAIMCGLKVLQQFSKPFFYDWIILKGVCVFGLVFWPHLFELFDKPAYGSDRIWTLDQHRPLLTSGCRYYTWSGLRSSFLNFPKVSHKVQF